MSFIRVALTFAVMIGALVAGGVSMLSYIKDNYPATFLLMRYERKCPTASRLIIKVLQEWVECEETKGAEHEK